MADIGMIPLSSDESFHFELLRILAASRYGGADITEVLGAASKIVAGDFESFYNAFSTLAEHVYKSAEGFKNPVSIRDAMFRAATYFRAADFYLHGNWDDPRIVYLWKKQTECFDKAISLLPIPGKRDLIQADGFKVPVIFYAASTDNSVKRPTVILGNGFDGSQEEIYHQIGISVLERGWNVITYEGPGQPTVRRNQGLGFRYDWEKVLTPVVDYLHTIPSVATQKIGLVGNSLGGYLAARAAAFEHRIAAVILIDGLWDFRANSPEGSSKVQNGSAGEIIKSANVPTKIKWAVSHGLWAFATHNVQEFINKAESMTLTGVADKSKLNEVHALCLQF
jgi:hypothetical protein